MKWKSLLTAYTTTYADYLGPSTYDVHTNGNDHAQMYASGWERGGQLHVDVHTEN